MHRPQPRITSLITADPPRRRAPRRLRAPGAMPASFARAALTTSGQILLGMAVGQVGVIAYDWLTAGPGPFVVFGL